MVPIFALATLDNYRWCTRGVNHTNSEAQPSDHAASRKLPCYHVCNFSFARMHRKWHDLYTAIESFASYYYWIPKLWHSFARVGHARKACEDISWHLILRKPAQPEKQALFLHSQVKGGLPRPDHRRLCSARLYKLSALVTFLGFTFGLAALLTILDEIELPGSRMTVFDIAEMAGYAFQTTRLFMLAVTLVAAHQRRDWKVFSPVDGVAVGIPVQHHYVIA